MATAKVVTTASDRVKTLFEGLEREARTFIANNFPRPHVEPPGSVDEPTHDVKLVKEDGSEATYNSGNGWSDDPENAKPVEDGSALK